MRPAGGRPEAIIAVAGAALAAGGTALSGDGAAIAAAMALAGASVGILRRLPVIACLVAAAAMGLSVAIAGLPAAAFSLGLLLAFCVGRWASTGGAILSALALLAAIEYDVYLRHDDGVPPIIFVAAACGAGIALRDRERVAARLAQRARELEEEREAHARLSVRFERARIAAELHDIVAHSLSVMVVQATAGQRLAAVDAELTAETFESIAGAAHQAEQDIRRLVELLSVERATEPAVDPAMIEQLVARAQDNGLHVTLRVKGDDHEVPADIAASAYRIVQEGLTNALRYAAGAPVTVTVRAAPSELLVTVRNDPGSPMSGLADVGTGHGLQGLRELVGAVGGTLAAAATPDGGWELAARLPTMPRAAASTAHERGHGRA